MCICVYLYMYICKHVCVYVYMYLMPGRPGLYDNMLRLFTLYSSKLKNSMAWLIAVMHPGKDPRKSAPRARASTPCGGLSVACRCSMLPPASGAWTAQQVPLCARLHSFTRRFSADPSSRFSADRSSSPCRDTFSSSTPADALCPLGLVQPSPAEGGPSETPPAPRGVSFFIVSTSASPSVAARPPAALETLSHSAESPSMSC